MKIKRFNKLNENYDQNKVKFIEAELIGIIEYGAVRVDVNGKSITINIEESVNLFEMTFHVKDKNEVEYLESIGVEFYPGGEIKSEDFKDQIQDFYQNNKKV